jgi:hypothetical protein
VSNPEKPYVDPEWVRNFQKRGQAEKAGDHATARRRKALAVANVARAKRRWLRREAERRSVAEAIVAHQEAGAARAAWLRHVVTTAVRPRERRDASGRSSARSGDSPDDDPSSSEPASREGGRP